MSSLSRREFLRTGLAAGAVASLSGPLGSVALSGQRARPNIVFILGDDWGLDNTGCYGSDRHKNRTPNIDALAAGGLRFERCYSTPAVRADPLRDQHGPVCLPDGRLDQSGLRPAQIAGRIPGGTDPQGGRL